MRWFKFKSLRQKINMYMFVGIFIPFILLGFVHTWISTRHIEMILMENTEQMLMQVDMMITFYMQNIENTIGIVEENEHVKDFMEGNVNPESEDRIRVFLAGIEKLYPEIAGILIVNGENRYISNEIFLTARDPLTEEEWYKRAVESPGESIFISKPQGRNLTSYSNFGADEIMSFIKSVKNSGTSVYDGVILLDLRLNAFDENIRNITLGSEGFLYVTDKQGEDIIYAPYNNVIYRIDNQFVLNNPEKKTVIKIHEEFYQVVCRRAANWNVIGIFPISDIMSTINLLRNVTVILFTITIILIQIFSKQFDKILIKPLSKLQTLMNEAENGHIDVRFNVKYDDEIGALGNSFNRMINEIKKLLEIIAKENRLKREAELKALQEQIRPHFLYNTMDTINWLADEHGISEITTLVSALTNLFRLSLSNGKEFVTIHDEIMHVKNYLIIQDVRYEEALDYSFDVPSEVSNYYVLKLILQPLVENSIYHGIKEKSTRNKDYKGLISVMVKKTKDMIILTVRDDGMGIAPHKVTELNRMFETENLAVGFGLYNVNKRLKYSFGAKYGLNITSILGEVTEITVSHPIMEVDSFESTYS